MESYQDPGQLAKYHFIAVFVEPKLQDGRPAA